MKHLKSLFLSMTLICALAVTALAGETQGPLCPTPGQTETPPCASQSLNDDSTNPGQSPIAPGQTSSPPASDAVDLTDIVEAALWALSIF